MIYTCKICKEKFKRVSMTVEKDKCIVCNDLKLSLDNFLQFINNNKFKDLDIDNINYTPTGMPKCPKCKETLCLHEVQALNGYIETLLMLGEITYEEIEDTTEDDTLYYSCIKCDRHYKMANPHYLDFLYF